MYTSMEPSKKFLNIPKKLKIVIKLFMFRNMYPVYCHISPSKKIQVGRSVGASKNVLLVLFKNP